MKQLVEYAFLFNFTVQLRINKNNAKHDAYRYIIARIRQKEKYGINPWHQS